MYNVTTLILLRILFKLFYENKYQYKMTDISEIYSNVLDIQQRPRGPMPGFSIVHSHMAFAL